MTIATLWHLRWVGRLPRLESFIKIPANVRGSVVIAAREVSWRRHLSGVIVIPILRASGWGQMTGLAFRGRLGSPGRGGR